MISGAQKAFPAARLELIRALGVRRSEKASSTLIKAAYEKDSIIRHAALVSLMQAGQKGCYPDLISLLESPAEPTDRPAILKAAIAVGSRVADQKKCVRPILKTMKKAPAVDELSLTHSPLPRPSGELSIAPLLESDPSLKTYIISGTPIRPAYSIQAPMQRPARKSLTSPSARAPPW